MTAIMKKEPKEATLPPAKQKESPGERAAALKAIADTRRATAWSVHRYPLTKKIVSTRTKVHLPRAYRAAAPPGGGKGRAVDVRTVWAGQDVNLLVYEHYLEMREKSDPKSEDGPGGGGERTPNYVAPDEVLPRR